MTDRPNRNDWQMTGDPPGGYLLDPDIGRTHVLAQRCPWCGYAMDRATGVASDKAPEPGEPDAAGARTSPKVAPD
jgi:hypothetical protein